MIVKSILVCMLLIVTSITPREALTEPLGLIGLTNRESIAAHKPILAAHRGGVITDDAPECSLRAIRLAQQRGYSMIELDIQRSLDGIPILFHDRTMIDACGMDTSISELTRDEIVAIHYTGTDQTIVTLDTALQECKKLNLGVMLDLKARGDAAFYKSIAELIRTHGLQNATVTFSGDPLFREHIQDVAWLSVSREQFSAVESGEAVDLRNRFWFGLPQNIPSEMVPKLQANGALVMPAINIFRYPEENHMQLAKEDIERLNNAGVDGYQIDSVYDVHFFGEAD